LILQVVRLFAGSVHHFIKAWMILKILVFFIYFNLELETSFNTEENNPLETIVWLLCGTNTHKNECPIFAQNHESCTLKTIGRREINGRWHWYSWKIAELTLNSNHSFTHSIVSDNINEQAADTRGYLNFWPLELKYE